MQFNYNFPKISFTEEIHKKSAIIYTYTHKDNKFNFGSNEPFLTKYESLLNKKSDTITSFFDNENYIVCINVKEKNFENSLLKAILAVPNTIEKISICFSEENFYDKLLVSKVLFNAKTDWNLKNKKEDINHRDIYLVVKDKKKYETKFGVNLAYSKAVVHQLLKMPGNYLTPTKFGEFAEKLTTEVNNSKLTCKVYNKKYIKDQKMGSFLSVSKGSEEEPTLIVLEYKGRKDSDKNDIVLVGKGLTFDSGGISIKSAINMEDMKFDMAGAATCLGAILYTAKSNLNINMVVVIACCENMPDGKAVKPGDVVTAMDGTTIEVINTDAEGRLVLADALTYAKQFEGKYTIDIATLTGACFMALGDVHSGMFTKDEHLASLLKESGIKMKDKVWGMPLDEEYEEMLESNIADIKNLQVGKGAGAQNGAIFLQKFAPKNGWCHLDIAGTSFKSGNGTARPLGMITDFLHKL